jgi:hypothetical protein
LSKSSCWLRPARCRESSDVIRRERCPSSTSRNAKPFPTSPAR